MRKLAFSLLAVVSLFGLSSPAALIAQPKQHNVQLTWTDPNNPAGTTYNVYRPQGACPIPSPLAGGNFTKITPTPLSSLTYTDNTVNLGPRCYYVTAVATVGGVTEESAPSASAPGTAVPFTVTISILVAQ